ncbi:zinc finger protein 862-like isoform X1 [Brienomyrus brachyistius]|nr:zinc finger protein 862-like isoform X1 [Brienomyrus brachyistius]
MHCIHCKTCGTEFAGNTAFATESTHFKRESLVKHGESAKHKKCRDKCVAKTSVSSGSIVKAFNRQDTASRSAQLAELNVKFNTAYTIAKEELAFTKFKPMLQLMKKNGIAINMTYANDKSCANIIGVIADTIRENTAVKVSSAQYISFMIDGDTDLSVKECVIVYVRILLDGQPTTILIGHVEVEHANADGIYAASKSAFAGLGDSCHNWMQKTVAMGANGAAVNLGKKGGVSVKLQEEAGKHIIPFHCMPHRLELALLSAQKDSPWVGNVYNLLHLIWKTYHFSSKSRRELKRLGVELGVSVNNPGGVKGTRWLPHVSRALDVLLKQEKKEGTLEDSGQYTAVYAHMDHLAASSTNADIAGRAKHIKETMEDGSFLAFCHFLADLFSAISKYSLLLQRNDVILPQAVSSLRNLILNVEAMAVRPCPGGKLASFHAAMKTQRDAREQEQEMQPQFMFRGVPLRKGEAENMAKDGPISQTAPRLQKQIETTVAAIVKQLHLRFSSLLCQEEHGMDTSVTKAVKCFHVFNHDVWPETAEELVDYGIEEVTFLLDHFQYVLERNGCDCALAMEEFQTLKTLVFMSFKDKSYHRLWEVLLTKEPYSSDLQNILHLVKIMLVLPVSSAQCERGFSIQKRIKSDIRSSLHPNSVEDLIRISVEGPPLEAFDASASVKRWMSEGQRAKRPNFKSWPQDM